MKEVKKLFYTPKEVKELLVISATTLWRWEKEGYLMPVKVGGVNRYRVEDINRIING